MPSGQGTAAGMQAVTAVPAASGWRAPGRRGPVLRGGGDSGEPSAFRRTLVHAWAPGSMPGAQTEACACGMRALGPCTPRTREALSVPAPQTPPSGGVLPSPGRTCRASGSGRCGPLPRHAEDTLSPLPPSLPPAWRRGVRIASNSLKGQRDGAAQPKRQTMTMTMAMTTATGGEQSEARTPACRGGGRPRRAGCGVAAAAPGSPVPSPGRGEGTTGARPGRGGHGGLSA